MGVNKVAGYSQRGWLGTVGWWVAHTWGLPTPGGCTPPGTQAELVVDSGGVGGKVSAELEQWAEGRTGLALAGGV